MQIPKSSVQLQLLEKTCDCLTGCSDWHLDLSVHVVLYLSRCLVEVWVAGFFSAYLCTDKVLYLLRGLHDLFWVYWWFRMWIYELYPYVISGTWQRSSWRSKAAQQFSPSLSESKQTWRGRSKCTVV